MSIETQELAVRYGSALPRHQPRPVVDTERYNAVARISARFKGLPTASTGT